MLYLRFQTFITEASLLKTLEMLNGKSFGIVSGGNEDNNKLLKIAATKMGYTLFDLTGEVVEPAKKKGEEETRIPDTSFVVVGGEKTQPGDMRKFLFHQAERFGQKSFLFKPANKEKVYVIGSSEQAWPGRGQVAPLGEYKPGKFLAFVKKYKGDKFEFVGLNPEHF